MEFFNLYVTLSRSQLNITLQVSEWTIKLYILYEVTYSFASLNFFRYTVLH